ncbi:transcription termination/antitermination protein NusA [Candidatus Marinamargulisbacteria bacterium SCGC AG-414-C22]|nr:transcription termination/antitermination protein NusA [Candidatus Marinamargulisbacteria bacterium SCGC AG-414-C22]
MIVIDNLKQVANQIETERGVAKEILYSAIEQALASACRKKLNTEETIVCILDVENNSVDFYKSKLIVDTVEDDVIEISLKDAKKLDKTYKVDEEVRTKFDPPDFGRIAAQTAKQVIIQRLREAEKDSVYDEYSTKTDQIITGTIQRVENRNYLVNLGRTEAILHYRDQIPGENFLQNESIRVYINNVEKTNKGNAIHITRTHPGFLKKLFEKEIPEIQDGIIEIMSVSRIPGDRAKIAVKTNNPTIGAVGTCVGQMGNRIQSIIKELHNEKIDVLDWDEDIRKFISNALKPAQIDDVIIDDLENKQATVMVPNNQLSLAIGKGGSNVRLSVLLTGWKLNIVDQNNPNPEAEKSGESLLEKMQSAKTEEDETKENQEESDSISLENSSLAKAISNQKEEKEEETATNNSSLTANIKKDLEEENKEG